MYKLFKKPQSTGHMAASEAYNALEEQVVRPTLAT
jgi:hypothetical protein